ncbi:MAG: sigma-54-dependent Fis family transcriptional regulator [Nitrospirae bacterium]|nr:sigma-54-dependent Fis family transcriptional regulator [Nitrospirota bacterium]
MSAANGQSILVVDDDDSVRESLTYLLEGAGYQVVPAASGEEALKLVDSAPFSLFLTDLKMPGLDGIDLIDRIRERQPGLNGIVLTGHGSVDSAVAAMKSGAYDYIAKPFDVDELLITVARAIEFGSLKRENFTLKRTLRDKYRFGNMIGASEASHKVYRIIERVADTDSTVLITGESGTGKELVARTLHFNSQRRERPLIPINCGAIPEHLLESELFGHERGAFTGAAATRIGRFESAHGGTLFLDEIGEMHPTLQVKLLRAIQEREFTRVGGNKPIRVDVRIIAATNQNLEQQVREKKFREDLFYRLNVIPIEVPPLRERRDDVALLVDHFLRRFNEGKGARTTGFSDEALALLTAYDWPGNIRELENTVERLVILEGGCMIGPEALPEKIGQRNVTAAMGRVVLPDDGLNFDATVAEFEDALILQALERSKWVKNRAAQLLGLNRTTLVEKIKKKGLEDRFSPKTRTRQVEVPGSPLSQ